MIVTADLAISLDGFIAGTDVTLENPGGDGAEPLSEWIHNLASRRQRQGMTGGEENRDSELMREWFDATGAVAMGRMMYDTGEEFAGGARTVRQYLGEGLIDELQLHVVPALLGDGLRLFEGLGAGRRNLEPIRVVDTPLATHLKYHFVKRPGRQAHTVDAQTPAERRPVRGMASRGGGQGAWFVVGQYGGVQVFDRGHG